MKKPTIKDIVTDGGYTWVIKRVMQGFNGRVRIDAQTRFYDRSEGAVNFFSEWATLKYINRCRREEGYNPISITNY